MKKFLKRLLRIVAAITWTGYVYDQAMKLGWDYGKRLGNEGRVNYIVAWSGGLEAPSYVGFETAEEAWAQADHWAQEMSESDWMDVLDATGETIERLERK